MKIRTPLHAAHPGDSHFRGLPVAIACRMISTRKQGRKEIRQHVSLTFIMLCWFIRDFWHSVDFGLFCMFSCCPLQCMFVAAHFHFPSVLLCVIFPVVAQTILALFLWRQDCAHLRRGCFHPRRAGFLIHCHACSVSAPSSRLCLNLVS